MKSKITSQQIEKPFSSHYDTLRSIYAVNGFESFMESLIECVRREITDNPVIDIESLRLRQGELVMAKKILLRSKEAFLSTIIKKPLPSQAEEVKL